MATSTSNPPQDSPHRERSGARGRGAPHLSTFDDVELVTSHAPKVERQLPEPRRMFERFAAVDIRFVAEPEPARSDGFELFGDSDDPPYPGFSRTLFAHIHAQLEQMGGARGEREPIEQAPTWSYGERDVVELRALSRFAAELCEVEPTERRRLLLQELASIDASHASEAPEQPERVVDESYAIDPGSELDDLYPPFLGMLAKAPPNLKGRKVGVLVSAGTPAHLLEALERQLLRAGARMAIIAPRSARIRDDRGHVVPVSYELSATPCVLFDAVAVITSESGAEELARDRAARSWVFEAFQHCRVVGYSVGAALLLLRSGIDELGGLMLLTCEHDASLFVKLAMASRSWEREGSADPDRSGKRERDVPPPPPSRPARWAS